MKKKTFPQEWYLHRSKESTREEIKDTVLRARPTLDLLKEIVEHEIQSMETKASDYDCPSWAYKAADQAGYQRALIKILKLVDLEGIEA